MRPSIHCLPTSVFQVPLTIVLAQSILTQLDGQICIVIDQKQQQPVSCDYTNYPKVVPPDWTCLGVAMLVLSSSNTLVNAQQRTSSKMT